MAQRSRQQVVQASMTQGTQTEEGKELSAAGIHLGAFGEVGQMTEETVDFLIRVLEDRKQELLVSGGKEVRVKAAYAKHEGGSTEVEPPYHRRRLPVDANNSGDADSASVTELVRSHSYEALVQLEGILESRHNQLMSDGLLEIPDREANALDR